MAQTHRSLRSQAARLMASGQRGLPQRLSASRANAQLAGRPPAEPYASRLHGAPYSCDGEAGDPIPTLRAAMIYARETLQRGQRLDILRGETVVARYVHDGQRVGRMLL